MRTILKILSVLGISIFISKPSASQNTVSLLQKCPESQPCVLMTLNKGKSDITIKQENQVDDLFTEFLFAVKGKLDNSAENTYSLTFKAFTDGIECTDFGQGNVAVAGFTDKNEPVLHTDKGKLTVMDNSLSVGCKDCLELSDGEKTAYKMLTPSWDMYLTKHKHSDISWNNNGEVFILSSGQCLSYNQNKLFNISKKENCESKSVRTKVEHTDKGPLWHFEIKNNSYKGKMFTGACT